MKHFGLQIVEERYLQRSKKDKWTQIRMTQKIKMKL